MLPIGFLDYGAGKRLLARYRDPGIGEYGSPLEMVTQTISERVDCTDTRSSWRKDADLVNTHMAVGSCGADLGLCRLSWQQ